VFLLLMFAVAAFLVRRIARRVRSAHAALPAHAGDDPEAELHPAGGPPPHE
jgi:hypothetical protein